MRNGEAVLHGVVTQVMALAFFALMYLTLDLLWDLPMEVAVGAAVVFALSAPVRWP